MATNKEGNNIKVVCRLRPINQKEKDLGGELCMTHSTETVKISVNNSYQENEDNNINTNGSTNGSTNENTFTYDRVFGPDSKQSEVFEYSARPIIQSAMEGWNGTLFCYGQTSSGKTHTMEGKHDNPEYKGIIPRMMEYVFELITNASADIDFTVKCSFLEIYNEKIQDLLDPRKNNLIVKEEKSKGIWVDDATEIYVLSQQEMYDVFKIGSDNRKVGATSMNAKSSRSHSLFIVTIFQKNNITDSTKSGKLYFVDLAGSEKMSKTGIEGGAMLEEAKNINKSLLNLGMVINSLTEGRSHVPYRDSKLTRVLQESLGGNSQTTLVINCSMSKFNDKESISTLRFGQRAKSIKNKAVVNTERSAKELLLKLHEAEQKIKYYQNLCDRDRDSSDTTRSDNGGKFLVLSNSCKDCSNATRQLLNQHIEIVQIQEELEKIRLVKDDLEEEVKSRNTELYELNEKVERSELKAKLFIEEEVRTFQEIQIRLEDIFLLNQNKLLEINKVINFIEKTRYEMKSKSAIVQKYNYDNYQNDLINYNRNLESALDHLTRLEEFIINDNKKFNGLVELISDENMDYNSNLFDQMNVSHAPNLEVTQFVLEDSCHNYSTSSKRKNHSVSYSPNKILKLSVPNSSAYRNKSLSWVPVFASFTNDDNINMENSSQDVPNPNPTHSQYDYQLLHRQRRTICQFVLEYKSIKDNLFHVKKENMEKEIILSKNSENYAKSEFKIKEYQEIIKELNEKLMKIEVDFDNYKGKSFLDLQYKEKKIIELINNVSDLEDENYKLINYNKDKDKKKYLMMEKQIKEFTIEMQRLISENSKLKSIYDQREEEVKSLSNKIKDLENKYEESMKYKAMSKTDVSFAGTGCADLRSEISRPVTSYLNSSGKAFHSSSLENILANKIRKLNSSSPKSSHFRRSSGNSTIYTGPINISPRHQNKNPNGNGSKFYHVSIHTNNDHNNNYNQNNYNNIYNNNNSPVNGNNRIMRVIRGGNNSNSSYKMLNQVQIMNNRNISFSQLDKLRKLKYEQELKFLDTYDEFEFNNSKDIEVVEDDSNK